MRPARGVLTLFAVLIWLLAAPAADAEVISSVIGGLLSATGDNDPNSILIGCVGGNIKVNGLDPGGGPAACSSITALTAAGGGGDDTISFSTDESKLPALASVSFAGGPGRDALFALYPLKIPNHMDGGPDDDSLSGGVGDDILDGGLGTDHIRILALGDVTLTDTSMTGEGTDVINSIDTIEIDGLDVANVIDGSTYSGRMTVYAGGGGDTIRGGTSADLLYGERGGDTLSGGGGDDVLAGGGAPAGGGGGGGRWGGGGAPPSSIRRTTAATAAPGPTSSRRPVAPASR